MGQLVVLVIFGCPIVGGLLYAFYERSLKHREEMLRLQLEAQSKTDQRVLELRGELAELRERVNEHVLAKDDLEDLRTRVQG